MSEIKKYVRIKRAYSKGVWYANQIGSVFPSLGTWENAYKVDSPDRALYIRQEDARLLDEYTTPCLDYRLYMHSPMFPVKERRSRSGLHTRHLYYTPS